MYFYYGNAIIDSSSFSQLARTSRRQSRIAGLEVPNRSDGCRRCSAITKDHISADASIQPVSYKVASAEALLNPMSSDARQI
jgi:hypothetical protein